MSETTVSIAERHQGPPATANGGVVAGLLAATIGPTASVRLEAAVPLEAPLRLDAAEAEVSLWADGQRLAVAHEVEAPPTPPGAPPRAHAEATIGPTADQHAFPHCFVCGPSAVDGLHITPGPLLDDEDAVATTWSPNPTKAGLDVERLAWAALDCPSGLAAMRDGVPAVLGTMTAHLARPLVAGEPIVVVGRLEGTDGRKRHATSALYDVDGEAVAWASAVWIAVSP